jgi:hypothetical protein
MALQKRVVPVLLRGLDQRGPRQTAITGELENLRNMVIVKGNAGGYELVPRPGESAMSKTTDVGTITTGMRLGVLGTALVLFTGTACHRRALDGWHLVDSTAPVMGVDVVPVASDTVRAQSADSKYVNGYKVSAVIADETGSNFTLRVSVVDSTGASVITARNLDTGNLQSVRVEVSGTVAVVFWGNDTSLRAAKFDSAAPSTIGAPVDVSVTFVAPMFDVQRVPASGNIAVAYTIFGNQLTQSFVNPTTMAVSGTTSYPALTSLAPFAYLTNDFSTSVLYIAHVGASGLGVTTFLGSTLGALGSSIYDATITSAHNIAGNRAGAAVSVYFTTGAAAAYDFRIRVSTGGAAAEVIRSLHLASRVISENGTLYAMARYRGEGQGSYFLLDLVAKKSVGEAIPLKAYTGLTGASASYDQLPNLAAAATSSTWLTAGLMNVAMVVVDGIPTAYVGASTITWTFQDATVGRPVELGGVLHVPGALPFTYDGNALVESGFPIGPEQGSLTPAVGGAMSAGHSYAYAYVFGATDAAGNLVRSKPTAEFNVTLGAADTMVTHSIPSLRLTRKALVFVEVYRRNLTANEVILRKVTSSASPTFNNTAADRVTFVDQVSDVTAASGEPIYTEGLVLENIAPPPCRTMAVHRGRLLVGGIAGDPAAIWTSKDVIPGFGVAFSDALVSRLSTAEAITALGSVDSYAVACTGVGNGSTWASSNDFPDDTAAGGVLKFEHMSGSVGCTSPMLMARTDDGLHVWSGTQGSTQSGLKGPYLITRGMSFEQVGAAAEDDAVLMTPAAVLAVPTRNQVRFLGSSSDVAATVGVALVRENFFKTWARWDYTQRLSAVVDAVVWQGAAAVLTSDGTVYTETLTDTVIDDLGVPASVPHRFDLAAFNFGGVAGYSRIRLGQLTGTVKGAAAVFTLSVVQTADGVAMAAKTRVITGQADGSALDVEFDPGNAGKCSAYALRISDSGNSANAAFTLAAVTMEVGIKPGLSRLPVSRRMT